MNRLPPYKSFPELQTKRLLLRRTTLADIPELLDILTYEGRACSDMEEGELVAAKIEADYQDGNGINWCIVNAHTNNPIGFIGYYRGFANGTGEIGFILKEAERRKGFMQEALQAAIEFGRNNMLLQKILAYTHETNLASRALLEKSGFAYQSEDVSGYWVYSLNSVNITV